MVDMKAVLVQREYCADHLRAAQRDRWVTEAGRAGGTPRLVCQMLAWFGRRLVAWGRACNDTMVSCLAGAIGRG